MTAVILFKSGSIRYINSHTNKNHPCQSVSKGYRHANVDIILNDSVNRLLYIVQIYKLF